MQKNRQPAPPAGDIPVLFDIVERGKNAPTEDQIKPQPSEPLHSDAGKPADGKPAATLPKQPPAKDTGSDTGGGIVDKTPAISAELVEMTLQKLMPQMETLMRVTLNHLVRSAESDKAD